MVAASVACAPTNIVDANINVVMQNILNGANTIGVPLPPQRVDRIVARMRLRVNDINRIEYYAFVAGRNAAMDERRHQRAVARFAVEQAAQEKRDRIAAEEARLADEEQRAALAEFDASFQKMVGAMPPNSTSKMRGLYILRALLARDAEKFHTMQACHTPDVFYQTRRRALLYVKPFLSEKTYSIIVGLKHSAPR